MVARDQTKELLGNFSPVMEAKEKSGNLLKVLHNLGIGRLHSFHNLFLSKGWRSVFGFALQ